MERNLARLSRVALDAHCASKPAAEILNVRRRIGGAERDRTAGLLVANEALSQLSYSPTTYLSYQRSPAAESLSKTVVKQLQAGTEAAIHGIPALLFRFSAHERISSAQIRRIRNRVDRKNRRLVSGEERYLERLAGKIGRHPSGFLGPA